MASRSSGIRLTGGRLGGRRLRALASSATRPTADRVRESLFARLGDLEGARVLDLYAGTGALGAEAASRGAASLVFVESAARAVAVLRDNMERLGLEDRVRVVRDDAVRAVRRLGRQGARFELVFLDPPYESDEVARALAALVEAEVLEPGATVVVEHHRRHPVPPVEGLEVLDLRLYGDTAITRLAARRSSAGTGGSGTP